MLSGLRTLSEYINFFYIIYKISIGKLVKYSSQVPWDSWEAISPCLDIYIILYISFYIALILSALHIVT